MLLPCRVEFLSQLSLLACWPAPVIPFTLCFWSVGRGRWPRRARGGISDPALQNQAILKSKIHVCLAELRSGKYFIFTPVKLAVFHGEPERVIALY